MRRRTPVLVGIAVIAVALGVVPVTPATASSRASATPPSPPNSLLAVIRKPSAGRGSAGAAILQPKTNVGCTVLFTAVASPNATTFNQLTQAAAITPTDVWAVGFSNTGASSSTPDQNLAEHWNGTSWTVVGAPNVGAGFNDLTGVAANDSNDVWAVGNSQPGSFLNNLAIHWNGSSWAVVATPQPSTGHQVLTGVSALASNNVWAAGAYQNNSGVYNNLILHWDGSSWTATTLPNAGAGDNILQTLYARSGTDIWAVGQYLVSAASHNTTSNPWQTLIEHYNGSAWTIQTSTNPVSGDNALLNVSAVSATDAWAVGATQTTALLSQSLTEHWNGTAWSTVASPQIGSGDNIFYGLLTLSPNNAWASGFGRPSQGVGGNSLVEHWDGSAWTIQTADSPGAAGQAVSGLAALPGNEVWAVGDSLPSNASESTMILHFQLPPPTAVSAVAGDQSAVVSWTAPTCDGGFTTTGYQVTAWDGCSPQMTLPAASSPFTFNGVTNGSPFTFTVQAISTTLGAETASAPSAAVIPTGATVPAALTACSTKQYQYPSADPTNFTDIDATNLKLMVTPGVASYAIISGNADLWTANAGLNQDIGIKVSGGAFGTGQVVGWKESGGFAGTFSPNAAAVQSVVTLAASTAYTVELQWKANKSAPGALIVAGAGPLAGGGQSFSPTRLSMRLVPMSAATVVSVSTTQQYSLASSDGTTWMDIDSTGLKASVSVASDSIAVITGNADLWTANAGFNQDIAINVDGTLGPWKESGGFAGTFSPNAAFVQGVVPLTLAGSPHTLKLQWKTNKPASGATIFAGAGPWPAAGTFSPTRLTVVLLPSASALGGTATVQYNLANSDGAGWTPIDTTNLEFTASPAAGNYTYALTGNADLWTANAGFNQDIGIFITGGVYGSGTLVAWKESGGFAGTFSPNAAYVETQQHLQGGVTYTVWLAWKTNKQGTGSTIFAAAGPLSGTTSFSPTRVTATLLSSP